MMMMYDSIRRVLFYNMKCNDKKDKNDDDDDGGVFGMLWKIITSELISFL